MAPYGLDILQMKVFCWFRDPVVVELGISTHLNRRTIISEHISSLQSYIICTHCLTQLWLCKLLMKVVNNCSNIFYWVVLTQQNDMWNTRRNCKVADALTHVVKHVLQTLCEKPVGSFENWGSHSQVVVLVPVQSLRPSTWNGDLKKTRPGVSWLLRSVCSSRQRNPWMEKYGKLTEMSRSDGTHSCSLAFFWWTLIIPIAKYNNAALSTQHSLQLFEQF